MAYDEDLAERIRELIADERGATEKKMFRGLAFLLDGNMAVAASGQGGIMVRVDAGDVQTNPQLSQWVRRGIAHARTLPPK